MKLAKLTIPRKFYDKIISREKFFVSFDPWTDKVIVEIPYDEKNLLFKIQKTARMERKRPMTKENRDNYDTILSNKVYRSLE